MAWGKHISGPGRCVGHALEQDCIDALGLGTFSDDLRYQAALTSQLKVVPQDNCKKVYARMQERAHGCIA